MFHTCAARAELELTSCETQFLRIACLVVFGVSFFVAIATFKGFAGFKYNKPLGLWIIYILWPLVCSVVYIISQLILVFRTLEDRWPIGDIVFGTAFFTIAQVILFAFSATICDAIKHYIDGLFFFTLCILLSVMMVYKYWDSITVRVSVFSVYVQMQRTDGMSRKRTWSSRLARRRQCGRSRTRYLQAQTSTASITPTMRAHSTTGPAASSGVSAARSCTRTVAGGGTRHRESGIKRENERTHGPGLLTATHLRPLWLLAYSSIAHHRILYTRILLVSLDIDHLASLGSWHGFLVNASTHAAPGCTEDHGLYFFSLCA